MPDVVQQPDGAEREADAVRERRRAVPAAGPDVVQPAGGHRVGVGLARQVGDDLPDERSPDGVPVLTGRGRDLLPGLPPAAQRQVHRAEGVLEPGPGERRVPHDGPRGLGDVPQPLHGRRGYERAELAGDLDVAVDGVADDVAPRAGDGGTGTFCRTRPVDDARAPSEGPPRVAR